MLSSLPPFSPLYSLALPLISLTAFNGPSCLSFTPPLSSPFSRFPVISNLLLVPCNIKFPTSCLVVSSSSREKVKTSPCCCVMLVLFHLLKQRHLAQERRHNRQQKRQLAMMLRIKLSIRTRHFIKTTSLGNANASAWQHLYHGPDEGSFVVSTSLTRAAFQTLLAEFSKHYNVKSGPGKAGRPPKATYKSTILGLLLCFYTGTSDGASLCREFAMPPSTLYRVLHNAEVALDKALRSLKDAQIRWPTYAEQVEWGWLVERKESVVKCKFGFVDGKNFRVQQPSHQDLQNAMYNGWLHSVLVTGVLAFGVDGCIFWMKHNCPGSWNDAEMSRDFRKKLLDDRRTMPEYGVTADSAFPASSDMFGKIVTPSKDGEENNVPLAARRGVKTMSAAITSIRQAAEWGMGAVEKVYKRLHLRLPYNQKTRALRLTNIHRLFNFRTRQTGISQIRSTFYQ